MWVNKNLYQHVLDDNKMLLDVWRVTHGANQLLCGEHTALKQQKAKDDLSIDWMRHRINALEKERAILLNKVGGIQIPVPEIVPTRPGSVSDLPVGFDFMPNFEDVGDVKADALGIAHDEAGHLEFIERKTTAAREQMSR